MSLPVLDRDKSLAAAEESTRRFIELLRRVSDPSATAIGHWSIAELACHVSHVHAAVPQMLRGDGSPIKDHRKIAAVWDQKVVEDLERDLDVLTERIQRSWRETEALLRSQEWTAPVKWHGDLVGPTYSLAAVLINEALVHGLDIARAAGSEWKKHPEHARLAIFGFMPYLHEFVNHEVAKRLDATYELRIRGGWWVYATVSNGNLSISEYTDRGVDCHLSVDPVAYLLVGFNRENQWSAIAKGKILAWGRKPWLALTFGRLFDSP